MEKKVPLLAYLFHALNEKKIIQIDEIGKFVSDNFVDSNYNPIKNITINDYIHRIREYDTKPNDKELIDNIIDEILKVDSLPQK